MWNDVWSSHPCQQKYFNFWQHKFLGFSPLRHCQSSPTLTKRNLYWISKCVLIKFLFVLHFLLREIIDLIVTCINIVGYTGITTIVTASVWCSAARCYSASSGAAAILCISVTLSCYFFIPVDTKLLKTWKFEYYKICQIIL